MAHESTLYSVLRVPEEATAEEIKQAYRKLVKLWHPDLHPDDMSAEKRMAEINEAYTVLSDPSKKLKYDNSLSSKRAQEKARAEEQARKAARAAAAAAAAARPQPVKKPVSNVRPHYSDPDRAPGFSSADSSYVDFTKPEEPSSPFVVNGETPAGYHSDEASQAPAKRTSGTEMSSEPLTPGDKALENFSVMLCVFFPLIIPIVNKHLKESLELYPRSARYQDLMMSLRIVTVFALPLWAFLVFLILKAALRF